MGRACSRNEENRNPYKILVGKPERKRPLGRPRHRRVDNIKMDLREIGWGGADQWFSTFVRPRLGKLFFFIR
jgi:hypothetical protein